MKKKELLSRIVRLADSVRELTSIVDKLVKQHKYEPLLDEEINVANMYRGVLNNDSLKNMSFVIGPFNCHVRRMESAWSWEVREKQKKLEYGMSSSCLSGVIQCFSYYQVYRKDTKRVNEPSLTQEEAAKMQEEAAKMLDEMLGS